MLNNKSLLYPNFNPPFPNSVKTNLGKEFFKLLKRHFPKRHQMSKIFNKTTVKLSYSCCKNISSKNRRIINPPPTNCGCNCKNRSNCPLDNKCLTSSIIYRAIVSVISKPNKNTSEYLKLLLRTAIITIREILDTKNMLIARNCLNISGN